MLHKVDETLSEGNAAGDSPREAVFEIDRPVTADHHIRAPPNHDFSLHALAACCDKRGFDSDSEDSDEDSAVPHGRISPCTFLAWSKGCQRWSGDSIKEPIDAVRNEHSGVRLSVKVEPSTFLLLHTRRTNKRLSPIFTEAAAPPAPNPRGRRHAALGPAALPLRWLEH